MEVDGATIPRAEVNERVLSDKPVQKDAIEVSTSHRGIHKKQKPSTLLLPLPDS